MMCHNHSPYVSRRKPFARTVSTWSDDKNGEVGEMPRLRFFKPRSLRQDRFHHRQGHHLPRSLSARWSMMHDRPSGAEVSTSWTSRGIGDRGFENAEPSISLSRKLTGGGWHSLLSDILFVSPFLCRSLAEFKLQVSEGCPCGSCISGSSA